MLEIKRLGLSEYGEENRYYCEQEGQTCEVYYGLRVVPGEWIEILWDTYDEGLHIEEAIQEQSCYTRESFTSALRDPDYNKIVMVLNGEASGLLMGTNNLDKAKVAYINPRFVLKRFQQEVKDGRFWYLTCMFVSKELRHLGFARLIVRAAVDAIWEKKYTLALDVSESREFLPDILVEMSKELGFPIEKQLLGSQSYYAFRPLSDSEPLETEEVKP